MEGRYMTQGLRRKVHAWHALFSLERRDALNGLGLAVEVERNGYAVGAVLEVAACFRVDPLTRRACEFIAGKFAGMADDEGERVSAHVGAIALAHASESRSGFEALLGFGMVREGGVLISLIDALADNAAALIRAGDTTAVEQLWQTAQAGQPEFRRTAAAAALGRLIRRRLLHPLPEARVLGLLRDGSLDAYARREVLDALGYPPPGALPAEILRTVRRFIDGAPSGDGTAGAGRQSVDFRAVALGVLARQGLLESEPEMLRPHLGLRSEGATWRLDQSGRVSGAPALVGMLYSARPEAFSGPASDLLRAGDWIAVAQLTPFLRDGPRPAADSVSTALVERVRQSPPGSGEPDLLPLLARIAPERVASESWGDLSGWPPQARAALAGALALTSPSVNPTQRTGLLVVLMGDGQYGVRREAYRALGKLDPDELHSLCASWASSTESSVQPADRPFVVDLRRRAAEGAAWLEAPPPEGPVADLAEDPEPEVRDTFARCQRERREREWAATCLEHVLGVRDETALLRAWRYARALERTGDDETLEQLEHHRRLPDLPPGIRNWLGRLIKKLRARWDEVTRSWPEPWFARRGSLEELEGTVKGTGGEGATVRCWVWHLPASDPIGFGTWGGWCQHTALPTGQLTLRIAGRRPATILVNRAINPGGPTYFVGSGPYPERQASKQPD
jgi:hypothetical protein